MELTEYKRLVPSGGGLNGSVQNYTEARDLSGILRARHDRDQSWSSYTKDTISAKYEWIITNSALALSILMLVMTTTSERVIFKMSVDRLSPFRFVLAISCVLVSFIVYGLITLYKVMYTDRITTRMWQFPKRKLFVMAMLDTLSFTGLVVSAADVTPTMTVILLHASTPIICYMSQLTFPDREYSALQIKGANFIALAIAISLARSVTDMYYQRDIKIALSSIVYVVSASIQGIGTLYKEKAVIEWSQQLDIHFLSTCLFFFQLLCTLTLACVLYWIQAIHLSESFSFDVHLALGSQCLYEGSVPKRAVGQSNYNCQYGFVLVLAYVLSNAVMLECMDHVLQASSRILGRVMALSVFIAFLALGVYDNRIYSVVDVHIIGTIGLADIFSIICLLIGIDYHGRDAEPNVEMITSFDNT